MGKITDENRRKLEEADSFDDAALEGMVDKIFYQELDRLIVEKNVPILKIAVDSGYSKSYINKLRNPNNNGSKPDRNAVISIALAMNASLEETNYLLKCAHYQELYTRDELEAVVIWGLMRNKTGEEIRNMLRDRGMDDLIRDQKRGKE